MKKVSALIAYVACVGCTHINTGETDYRVADAPPARLTDASAKNNPCTGNSTTPCNTLVPLNKKYVAAGEDLIKDDVLSIQLEQLVMGDQLLEGRLFGQETGKTAQFAVLANVFEFGADKDTKARFIEVANYAGTPGDDNDTELKLVYFSDDVKRRQPMNFSNLPLFPRTKYNGRSVGIQIIIMEIDAGSSPIKSLLSTLARLGQSTLPASPVSGALLDLGKSLLDGNGNDRLFDYRFVLSPAGGDKSGLYPTLRTGRYVLRRTEKRATPQDWSNWKLDQNTARVYAPNDKTGKVDEYRGDDLTIVLSVRKDDPKSATEFLAYDDWSKASAAIEKAAADGNFLAGAEKSFDPLIKDLQSKKLRANLTGMWSVAHDRLQKFRSVPVPKTDGTFAGCEAESAKASGAGDLYQRDAEDTIAAFVRAFRTAAAAKSGDENSPLTLSEEAREQIVSAIARSFLEKDKADADELAKFASYDAFNTAYLAADKANALAQFAIGYETKARPAVETCPALLAFRIP